MKQKKHVLSFVVGVLLLFGVLTLAGCSNDSQSFVGSWKITSNAENFQVIEGDDSNLETYGFVFLESGEASVLLTGDETGFVFESDPFLAYTVTDGVIKVTTADSDGDLVFQKTSIPFTGEYKFQGDTLDITLVDGSVLSLEKMNS